MDGKTRTEIETIEDLESCYPQLVTEIRDEAIREIESWSVKKIRKKFPDLVRQIGSEIGFPQGPDMKVKGFLLEEFRLGERGRADKNEGDPFASGTLRTYENLKNIGGLQLPYILDFKCPFTRPTLEFYILISEGGGDYERAKIAREAMKKCK